MADSKSRKPYHVEFAEQLIEDLKHGAAPWQKPWGPGELHAPYNPVSGTVYHGINRVMLSRRGFDDPRWMTLKQANSADLRVRKGEKSQPIVYWQFSKEEPQLDDSGKPVVDNEGNQVMTKVELDRPIVRFSRVFHVSQLDGDVPPLDLSAVRPWDPNQKAETILENSGAVIKHNQRDRAFYSLRFDEICLPPKDRFPSADGYYSTALHELGHWTGHPSRLDREFGPFGSEVYAREELRAEIASWMLAQDMGIGHDPSQHRAYVASWVTVLEKDPYEIVRACRDAEKIMQHVLSMEKQQQQETAQEISAPQSREPAPEKTFLAVPYREKNRAREAGARWDHEAKLWYAPAGADMAQLKAWLPSHTPAPTPAVNPIDEFAQALREAGLVLKGSPVMDGQMHRVPVSGHPDARDGVYCAYLDGIPAGWFQNYRTGGVQKWIATGHSLTDEQKTTLRAEAEEQRQRREQNRLILQDKAAEICREAFENTRPAQPYDPYIRRKGIEPLGDVRRSSDGQLLLIPLQSIDGEIRNVQEIAPDGSKRFQKDAQKKGCFFLLDPDEQLSKNQTGEILLAEGYATGASLHMATGKPVAVAFDAGNLEPVAVALREKYPKAKIAICADNDHTKAVNVGLEKAKKAALAVGGAVIVPVFNSTEMSMGLKDFNDLHQSRGLEELGKLVSRRLAREATRTMGEEPQREIGKAVEMDR